jgi:hypothetical protein
MKQWLAGGRYGRTAWWVLREEREAHWEVGCAVQQRGASETRIRGYENVRHYYSPTTVRLSQDSSQGINSNMYMMKDCSGKGVLEVSSNR